MRSAASDEVAVGEVGVARRRAVAPVAEELAGDAYVSCQRPAWALIRSAQSGGGRSIHRPSALDASQAAISRWASRPSEIWGR